MAVEPLNPARPQLGDPVLVDEELRALKGVLKEHNEDIEDLGDTTSALVAAQNAIPPLIRDFMTKTTEESALQALGGKPAGISIFRSATMEPIIQGLIDAGLSAQIRTGPTSGGTGATIKLFGVQINIFQATIPSSGLNFTWLDAFPSTCLGAVCTMLEQSDNPMYLEGMPTAVGGKIDHVRSTPRDGCVIAIGR